MSQSRVAAMSLSFLGRASVSGISAGRWPGWPLGLSALPVLSRPVTVSKALAARPVSASSQNGNLSPKVLRLQDQTEGTGQGQWGRRVQSQVCRQSQAPPENMGGSLVPSAAGPGFPVYDRVTPVFASVCSWPSYLLVPFCLSRTWALHLGPSTTQKNLFLIFIY